jgi:hypothetical protein
MYFSGCWSTPPGHADSQQPSSTIDLAINRNAAYYLGEIPGPGEPGLLWFGWTVSLSSTNNVNVTIQFSHNSILWNNIVTFTVVNGTSRGQQNIDSSWAQPGENYLRVAYNQSFSQQTNLTVYTDYSQTLLQVLVAVLAIPIPLLVVSVGRRWRQWRKKLSP